MGIIFSRPVIGEGNPVTGEVEDEIDDESVAVMGVDIFPTELR